MTNLMQLTDDEVAVVAGGQSVSVFANQSNSFSILQSVTATDSGASGRLDEHFILRSRQILGRNDAELVRHLIAIGNPFSGHRLA
jgi:hypothetical protein